MLFSYPEKKKNIYLWGWKHTSINQGKLLIHLNAKFFCIIISGIVVLLEYLKMHKKGDPIKKINLTM